MDVDVVLVQMVSEDQFLVLVVLMDLIREI